MSVLLEIIKGNNDDVCSYLEHVSTNQFKADVMELAQSNADQTAIKSAIAELQKLVKQ